MSLEVKVLLLKGSIDISNSDALRQQAVDLINGGATNLLIDCSEVTFMDSSGLGALVMALKTMREAKGKLAICSIPDQIKMLFRLTGMDKVFTIYPSRADFERG